MSDCKEVFEEIYRTKLWGEGSGGGALPPVAQPFADLVSRLLVEMNVRMVLDIGCGDGRASSLWELGEAFYYGCDCSPAIIAKAKTLYPERLFFVKDSIEGPFPRGLFDLVVVKEVTQHLSDDDVMALFERLRVLGARVLHCSCMAPGIHNEGRTGGYRAVRLSDPPWNARTESMLEWEANGQPYQAELWRPGR